MKNDKRTKRKSEKTSNKNNTRQKSNQSRRTDARNEKTQNKTTTKHNKITKTYDDKPINQIQQKNETMDNSTPRMCAGHGINPNCIGQLDNNSRRHRIWCSESCRMYVNYKTRPQFKKKSLEYRERKRQDENQNKPKRAYRRQAPNQQDTTSPIQTEISELPDEVTKMVKDNPATASWNAAQKMMTQTNDPLLKFVGNNGELIVNVVKEFFKGFTAAKEASQQQTQQPQQYQQPQPPDGYGTLKALHKRDDPRWLAQARAWEAYIANSPHGQIDISRPKPTQYSVQRGASTIEASGARNLKDVAAVSKVLDSQNQPQQSNVPTTTDDDMKKLEEYRKNNDPLKDKINTHQPKEEEEQMTQQNQILIEEKLQLLISLFNEMSDEKLQQYAKTPKEAIQELDNIVKKPVVSMLIKPYVDVIKGIGLNEFKQVFEENCKEKLSNFSVDEKENFLVLLDEWRQKL